MWGPEIVYILVRLHPNMYIHPVAFDQYSELIEDVPINYLHQHSSNLQSVSLTSSNIVSPILVTSMYFSGNGYPSSRHEQFTSEFHVMTVIQISRDRSNIFFASTSFCDESCDEVDEDPSDSPRRTCYRGFRWIFSYPDLLNKFDFPIWV